VTSVAAENAEVCMTTQVSLNDQVTVGIPGLVNTLVWHLPSYKEIYKS